MAKSTAIPARVQAEIRKLHAKGLSDRAIVATLKKKKVSVARSSLQRLLASDAKRAADIATAKPLPDSITSVPIGNPLLALERHVELLNGRLAHAAHKGTTNEHIRAFKAVSEAIQELEKARAASNGGTATFKFLPELLAATKRNDDTLRRKDPAAWLGLQLPELTALVADLTEALTRVENPASHNVTGHLPTLAGKLRVQLDRFEAAMNATDTTPTETPAPNA